MEIPEHKHCEICWIVMDFTDENRFCKICKKKVKIKE